MKQSVVLLLLLLLTNKAFALWVKMDDCELINKSTIIVKAKFSEGNLTELTDIPTHIGSGTLIIEHVFKGARTLKKVLIQQPKPNGPRKSTDITFKQNQMGLWYLTSSTHDSIYSATHPQRYKPWSSEEESQLHRQLCSCKPPTIDLVPSKK